jgi:hypothetical protein
VLTFADGRAESPGESISRLLLVRLGFRVTVQVPAPGPQGTEYRLDFGIDEAFGEFDGWVKYSDPALLRGRTGSQALREEKQREDWIRGTTGRAVARWEWPDLKGQNTLAARLAAFGVRPASTRGAFFTSGREIPAPL